MALKVDPVRLTVEVFMTLCCRWMGFVLDQMMTEVVFMDIVSCFGQFRCDWKLSTTSELARTEGIRLSN
jgi:hypothetical protein